MIQHFRTRAWPLEADLTALCRGAWFFRGQEIPKIMLDECYDMELYNWRKANISDAVSPIYTYLVSCSTQFFLHAALAQ